MGIQGLLIALKSVIKVAKISDFRGKTVAVDGYCWLHKATYGCCTELCNGHDSKNWILYMIGYIDLLLLNGVNVVLVFDGDDLPAKKKTEEQREKSRTENLLKGQQYQAAGDHKNARNYFSRAVEVTPKMAARLIKILKKIRPSVKCIVAPYEADAQLSYLCMHNLVDAVVTEDSDTIPYGCKEIIFKLDKDTGFCQQFQLDSLWKEDISGFDLKSFTQEMLLIMCIASGCDYLSSVKGFGLKNSYKLVAKQKTAANLLKIMRFTGLIPLVPANTQLEMGQNESQSSLDSDDTEQAEIKRAVILNNSLLQYELDFYRALATFAHQVVFDPATRQTVHRTPLIFEQLPPCLQQIYGSARSANNETVELPFLGRLLSPQLSVGIADGLVDPITKIPFDLPEDSSFFDSADTTSKKGGGSSLSRHNTSSSSQSSNPSSSVMRTLESTIICLSQPGYSAAASSGGNSNKAVHRSYSTSYAQHAASISSKPKHASQDSASRKDPAVTPVRKGATASAVDNKRKANSIANYFAAGTKVDSSGAVPPTVLAASPKASSKQQRTENGRVAISLSRHQSVTGGRGVGAASFMQFADENAALVNVVHVSRPGAAAAAPAAMVEGIFFTPKDEGVAGGALCGYSATLSALTTGDSLQSPLRPARKAPLHHNEHLLDQCSVDSAPLEEVPLPYSRYQSPLVDIYATDGSSPPSGKKTTGKSSGGILLDSFSSGGVCGGSAPSPYFNSASAKLSSTSASLQRLYSMRQAQSTELLADMERLESMHSVMPRAEQGLSYDQSLSPPMKSHHRGILDIGPPPAGAVESKTLESKPNPFMQFMFSS